MRVSVIVLLLVNTCRLHTSSVNTRTSSYLYNNASFSDGEPEELHSGRICFFQSCHQRRHNRPPTLQRSDEEEPESPTRLTNILEGRDATSLGVPSKFQEPLDEFPTTDFQPPPVTVATYVNDTQSRVVPFVLNAQKGGRDKYPTIQLGQIVRKLIFPDWIWKGGSGMGELTRKVGQPSSDGGGAGIGNVTKNSPTGSSGVPISLFKLPRITFDNNYSHFFKLFTMVQFNNTPCIGPTGLAGICYHSAECDSFGGSGLGPCAGGLGVCCTFSYTCGGISRQNETYFVDSGMSYTATGVGTCSIEIVKLNSLVKQIRLDFEVFSLEQPSAGNCELDRFIVSGQNINNVVPILCGDNNGTHIYVETSGSGSIQLTVMTRGVAFRTWRIRITQIDMTSATIAPSYCLQQERGVVGTVNSFNYNSATTPQYLNNLNYAICIEKAPGFCSITFTNSGLNATYRPFHIVNANENGDLVIPSGQAGIGVRDCPFDYILINGNRLCGDKLNDGVSNAFLLVDVPVTDFSNGPFIVTVRTNEMDVGGGFFLYYRQNPCMPMRSPG